MNRTDLTSALATRSGLTPGQAEAALNALASVVTESLVRGDRVVLAGFATFDVVERPARMGRHPRTGEPLPIPARRAPRITAGTGLKRAVADS